MWTMYTRVHDIVSTSFTSMYYPVDIVDIVDIAMRTRYTRYRVNIVYHRYTIMLTLSTSSKSRCWKMYTQYRVKIVHIDVLSCLYRRYRRHRDSWMNENFSLFCLFVTGRDVLSLSVPQNVNIYLHNGIINENAGLRIIILLRPASPCVRDHVDVTIYAHHFAPTFNCGGQHHGHSLCLMPLSCRIVAVLIKQFYTFDFAMSTM